MSETITIYQKPTCSTCREVYKALKEKGVDFNAVDYYLNPIPKNKLKELLNKMGIRPAELVRTREAIYKTMNLSSKNLTDEQWIDLLVQHPDLIQRPIVEKGDRAVLARPAERLKEII